MTVEITVRGSFSSFQAPERGTVHATIGYEGPEMEPVYRQVARDLETVKESIAPLYDEAHGPVTWWSAQEVRTWSNRPWNQDGEQLPLVHHAAVGIEVKFRDFAELSRWVGVHVTGTTAFSLRRVEWALTAERREELRQQARTRAVRDAADRARQYADALELGTIRPVAIADAGMLDAGLHSDGPGAAQYRIAASVPSAGPDVELLPADIQVSAAVDARFAVG